MRVTLIVNPFASRVTEELVARVKAELRPVETLLTEGRGHAVELAAAAGGEALWVLGGDGLVNEVLNGLRPGVPLGVVPGGHTNVFARALGLGLRGRTERRISLGRVNTRRFAFAAGIGVDADAVRAMETEKREHAGRRPGDVAYAREVARRLLPRGCGGMLAFEIAGDVEAEAHRLVERIAALAPLAVAGSKRLLDMEEREALERALDREAALCEQLFETADAREGLAAFLEKREPRFRGS